MGLSPYGKPVYYDRFQELVELKGDGSYRLNMKYFDFDRRLVMPSKKFLELFGEPRKPSGQMTPHYENVAASLQKITEDVLFAMMNQIYQETRLKNLCMAGGVALNSVANGKITKNTPFKNVWGQPAASDAGSAMGAALYVYNTVFGKEREYILDSAYLGPGFSTNYIKNFLEQNKIIHSEFKDDKELCATTAKLIYEDNVVGWFQDRMEWGPRALGARSILSNACNPNMKEILNLKVKHREKFRPFAPVITEEDVHDWFEIDKDDESFMLFVYPIRPEKRKFIPAVTHVDGSGRLQTISEKQNLRYYTIIKEFEKLSKVPIIINTSFNIRGEPIVCTPRDAYSCMMGTGIDCLVMDKFLIWHKDNPKDMWDSEAIAGD
jgi:carbamoyltransferase